MQYKYANSINFLSHYHSFSLKTHLSRGEFFPNGINRNICKRCCASPPPVEGLLGEPSKGRSLMCPQRSPSDKHKTQPKADSCFGLLSASTNLPEVKMEKHFGSHHFEFMFSLPHGLSSSVSH